MTISSSDNDGIIALGNGVATQFTFPFKVNVASQVKVVLIDSAGSETLLALSTDYTVTNQNDEGNGYVSYPVTGSPLASGEKLVITPNMDFLQETDLRNQEGYNPELHEDALDTLMMHIKQIKGDIDRSLKLQIDSALSNLLMPKPEAGKLIGWSDPATSLSNYTAGDGSTTSATATGSTTSRTLADRFADAVNVKDFGAVGDGTTNDTTAIQNAVTLAASVGAAVYWPNGAYLKTSNITSFHSVKHTGQARILHGADVYWVNNTTNNVNKLYVATTGSSGNDGINSATPLNSISSALLILDKYQENSKGWEVVVASGTYTPTSEIKLENRYVKITGSSATLDFVSVASKHGIEVLDSELQISGVSVTNADLSGIAVGKGAYANISNGNFNSNGWRGIQARDGGRAYVTGCNADSNGITGYEALINGFMTIFNSNADGNTWAGFTCTNSSTMYINNAEADGNIRYAFECSGTSKMYLRDCDALNGAATAAAYLVSGSSLMYAHTCSASECARPIMAEFGAIFSGYLLTISNSSVLSSYPAFYAEYDSTITLVTIATTGVTTITNFNTAFLAEYNSKITANRTTYITLSGVTTVASPPVGVLGNENSFIHMDNLLSASQGQEGTYTPTLTAVSNAGSPTSSVSYWRRDGDTVKVWGQISRGAITAGANSQIAISLPISSNLTAAYQLVGGGCTTSPGTQQRGIIYGDTTNDRALFVQDSATTLSGAAFIYFEFVYKIL